MVVACKGCGKEVTRKPSEISASGLVFCSQSCSAKINNQRFLKRKKQVRGKCLFCHKDYYGDNRRFCSKECYLSHLPTKPRLNPEPAFSIERQCTECDRKINMHGTEGDKTTCSKKCSIAGARRKRDAMALAGEPFDFYKTQRALKEFIIRHTGHKCQICGVEEWRGQKTPLIMDHIDGNHSNNLRSNLRLVCPNCDAQLPTFKGKNRGRGDPRRRAYYRANPEKWRK